MQLQGHFGLAVDEHAATSPATEVDVVVLVYELFNGQEAGHCGAVEGTG